MMGPWSLITSYHTRKYWWRLLHNTALDQIELHSRHRPALFMTQRATASATTAATALSPAQRRAPRRSPTGAPGLTATMRLPAATARAARVTAARSVGVR